MSRYNSYGYYYDPVGSQSHQPSGYTYQSSAAAAPTFPSAPGSAGNTSSSYQYGSNSYSNQQYGASTNQQSSNSASHAAAALSSLSSQNYNQTSSSSSSANRGNATGQYDNSGWYTAASNSNAYNANNLPRTQSNSSSHYAPAPLNSSTFGRFSVPEPSQSASDTFAASSSYQAAAPSTSANTYQTGYHQAQNQPPRYSSPLQAVQAQRHGHSKHSSRSSAHKASPQMANAAHSAQQNAIRQQSASVEPSPTTVDPSQVYDNRAELQHKAQIEAEKRKKYEAEQAAKKAEEERIEAEKRRVEEERQKAEREAAEREAAKKEQEERKKEQKRKAREEKKQSKSAATALQKLASGGEGEGSSTAPPGTDEEAEMRAMFQKMREFNAKNPAMLAKLWEEERQSHAQSHSPQSAKPSSASSSKAPPRPTAPTAASPKALSPAQQDGVPPVSKPTSPASAAKAAVTASQNALQASPPQPAPHLAPPTTASSPATTSLWPPHKKGTLADATAKWLRAQPANANSLLSTQTVLNVLDRNPSYVQLCERLEDLGLKFDRAALARELLRAVPDGLKAQPVQPVARVAVSNEASRATVKEREDPRPVKAPSTVNYEAPISLATPVREMSSTGQQPPYPPDHPNQPPPSPFAAQPRPMSSSSRPPSQSQPPPPPEVKQEFKPEIPTRPPADKEEAARKRTFGDLVDLTAEDSEEDSTTLPPAKKVFSPAVSGAAATVNPSGVSAPQALQQYDYQQALSGDDYRSRHTVFQIQPTGPTTAMPSQSTPQLPSAAGPQTQQPINQPQPAQVLPSHPAPPPKPRGPTAEQQQHHRLRGKMLVEPLMRDRVARKSRYDARTIARDVLLATGRHPDMRGLNAHLGVMQKLLSAHGGDGGGAGEGGAGGARMDLGTVRWDVIDPEQEVEAEVIGRGEKTTVGEMNGIVAGHADGEATFTSSKPPAHPRLSGSATTVNHDGPSPQIPGVKRRGRPPKNTLRHYEGNANAKPRDSLTNVGLGGADTPRETSSSPRPTQTQARNANPASATASATLTMSAGRPVGYADFRQITADGTVVKKKGRPIGWRKNIHSREAQGLPPSTKPEAVAANAAKKEKNRMKDVIPGLVLQEPVYYPFRCGWRGCNAELHNLDTLRKHVVKVHGVRTQQDSGSDGGSGDEEEGGVFECWWKGCGADGKVQTFEGIEEWMKHVEDRHLRPVAWKLGDGPTVRDMSLLRHSTTSSNTPPSYLSDSRGRSVTPLVVPKFDTSASQNTSTTATSGKEEPDTTHPSMPVAPSQPVRLGPGRRRKDGTTTAAALEKDLSAPLKRLEEQQRGVGVLMGRMGCVLVSEERRATFLDGEDFEGLVDEDAEGWEGWE